MKMHLDPDNPKTGRTDWRRVDALTEADVEAAARSDPDSLPVTEEELGGMAPLPDVKSIRSKLGLSQEEFAKTFHLPVASVRDWEQGRFRPGQSSRTLLRIIAMMPEEVKAVLERH